MKTFGFTIGLSIMMLAILLLNACGKIGVGGKLDQMVGNWAQLNLPKDCRAKMIAASNHEVAVLCEDGRVFH